MAIGLGFQLLPGLPLGSWLRHGLRSGLALYFAAILGNFSQFYIFRLITQMANGYGGKTRG